MNHKSKSFPRSTIIFQLFIILSILIGCREDITNVEKNKKTTFKKIKYNPNGYDTNSIKNEEIKSIVYSNGDTIVTGKVLKLKVRYDSMLSSRKSVSINLGKKIDFNVNHSDELKGRIISQNYDMETSFKNIAFNKKIVDNDKGLKNSTGRKVVTGQTIACFMKKVNVVNTPFIPLDIPSRRDNSKYDISFFDIDQGLPSSNVRDLYHDSRGFLWIATDLGVFKYDGKNLAQYSKKEGMSGNIVWRIYEDSKGNMWFATLDGGITRYDGYSFFHLTESEGIASNRILSVIEDNSSNMWFASDGGGLIKLTGNNMTIYSTNEGLSTDYFFSITKDKLGRLWFASNGGGTVRYDGNYFSILTKNYYEDNSYHYISLYDSKQTLWIGTYAGGLYRYNKNKVVYYSQNTGFVGNSIRSIVEDNEGNIWVGTTNGLGKIQGETIQTFTQNDGLNGNSISSLSFDSKNAIWIGTTNGISIYDPKSFRQYDLSEYIKIYDNDNVKISTIVQYDDSLWFGLNKGYIKKVNDNYEYVRLNDEKSSSRGIWTFVKDKNGVNWYGNDFGLISYDGKKYTSYESLNNAKGIGLGKKYIRTMLSDSKGNLWYGTNGGGICMYDGKRVRKITMEEGISSNNISVITEDNLGRKIFGTGGGGIIIINGEDFINITEREGLPSNIVRSIVVDKNNNMWIATDRYGLILYNGTDFYIIDETQGLIGNNILSLTKSSDTSLWIATNKGISNIDISKAIINRKQSEINIEEIIIRNHSRNSGVIYRDFQLNSSTIDTKGNLWWGGNRRITVLDKNNENHGDDLLDSISIQHIIINDSFIDYNSSSDIPFIAKHNGLSRFKNIPINPIFESSVKDISIYFGNRNVNNHIDDEYSHRLLGYSNQWSIASSEKAAYFKNLPSGNYEFQVRKMHNNTAKGSIMTYAFTIKSPWWQTWWAYLLYIALSGTSIQGIVSWRTSFLRKKQETLLLQIQDATEEIRNQKQISDSLLLNILPETVANELKSKTNYTPKYHESASILFTDFQNFTQFSENISHEDLVELLHECFSHFDLLCKKHNLEKIKTIGDSYMAVGGLPIENTTHAHDAISAGIEMVEYIERIKPSILEKHGRTLEIRVGIHSGPVIAGVVGLTKYQYDVWGDTVNTASRIESASGPGKVNISQTTFNSVKNSKEYNYQERGNINTKGKGEITMYFVSKH